jgi:hypothetical protein
MVGVNQQPLAFETGDGHTVLSLSVGTKDKGLKIPVIGPACVNSDGRNVAPAVDAFGCEKIDLAAQRVSLRDQ